MVYSAGTMNDTGTAPAMPAWLVCCQNITPPQKDGSTFIRDLPLSSIDRFFVMEHTHVKVMVTDYGISASRVSLLCSFDPESEQAEIEDPISKGAIDFNRCYTRLRRCILHYLDTTTEIPATPNHAPPRPNGEIAPQAPAATLPPPRRRRSSPTKPRLSQSD